MWFFHHGLMSEVVARATAGPIAINFSGWRNIPGGIERATPVFGTNMVHNRRREFSGRGKSNRQMRFEARPAVYSASRRHRRRRGRTLPGLWDRLIERDQHADKEHDQHDKDDRDANHEQI